MKKVVKMVMATPPMAVCYLLGVRFPEYGVALGALGVVVYWAIIE